MTDAALFEDDGYEDLADEFESLDTDDTMEALDELDELADELDEFEEADEGDEMDELDEFSDELDEWDDADEGDDMDELGDFAYDGASGLYLPRPPGGLITGPAAVSLAQRLNPFVLEAMDADEADAFFRRIGRTLRRVGRGVIGGIRRVGRGVGRVAGRVGRVVGRVARVAAPLLRRALPMIQRVAGLAGPWGRLISGGLGAIRGLAEGRGLRGALAGALSGVIPGVGGRLASAVLGGDGADDDAALDAMADLADARRVSGAVAVPVGAGLATRIATPRTISGRIPRAAIPAVRRAERTMLRAASAVGGTAGRRLRVLRAIGRLARALLRRRGGFVTVIGVPAAVRAAAQQVVARVRQRPAAGASTRAAAVRRVAARRAVLRRVPAAAVFPAFSPGRA